MTAKQKAAAAARRDLVNTVRAQFRPHFFTRCLEAAYRVIPRCQSCEYNIGGRCTVPPRTFTTAIEDKDALCLHWSPAPKAFITALMYANDLDSDAIQEAAPKVYRIQSSEDQKKETLPRGRHSKIDPDRFEEQLRLFRAGKVSAVQAAESLGITPGTFYKKARSAVSNESD